MTEKIEEIRVLVRNIDPSRFFARMDEWLRGGMCSPQLEARVSGTRIPPTPAFGATDLWVMREVQEYRAECESVVGAMGRGDHAAAVRHLRKIVKFETAYLEPKMPTKKQIELASDAISCKTCGMTKEMWLREHKRSIFRLKGGECGSCYMVTYRKRLAELQLIDPEVAAAS